MTLKLCSWIVLTTFLVFPPLGSAQKPPYYTDWGPHSQACCMVSDAAGDVFVAGTALKPTAQNPNNLFASTTMTKLDVNNNVVYTYSFRGNGDQIPTGLAVDAQGNLFVAGYTKVASGFPLLNPLITKTPPDTSNTGFVSKLSPTGVLIFSTLLGGTNETRANALSLDAHGNVFVTGWTAAGDFPVTPNAYQRTGPINFLYTYAFLTELSNAGDRIVFSTYLGNSHVACTSGGLTCVGATGESTANTIAVAQDGTILVAGTTNSDQFPTTAGVWQTSCICTYTASTGFVSKFSPDGSMLLWSTFLGAKTQTRSFGGTGITRLAIGSDGSVLVAGETPNTDFPVTSGAFQTRFVGTIDRLFITKLNASGSALVFSTFLSGSNYENVFGLLLDSQANPWVTGVTYSSDFPTLPNSLRLGDSFVAELAADGTALLASMELPNGAAGQALTLDASGNQILLGAAGSVLRIPAGGVSGSAVLGFANAEGYSVSGHVAPGEFVSFYGTGLGPTPGLLGQLDSSGKIATQITGVQVLFGGIAAPLLYAGPTQINAIVPFEVAANSSVPVIVTTPSGSLPTLTLNIVDADPEISIGAYPSTPAGLASAAALNQDGSVNSTATPAPAGTVISLWATGVGPFTEVFPDGSIVGSDLPSLVLPVSVIFDGNTRNSQNGSILYAGAAPQLVAGVLQVNVRIPPNLGTGAHQVVFQVGTHTSDPVAVAVQ